MKIIKNNKPKLDVIEMNVDDIIDKKLTKYPVIEELFGTSSTNIILGSTGSGKTALSISLIKNIFKGVFHQMIIIMPENSMISIKEKDNIFKKYIDKDDIYHDFNVDVLNEVYEKIDENASNGYYTFLFIDDYGNLLKNNDNAKILQSMFLKNRHLRLTIFLLCQNFSQCPKIIREITNNAILFNTNKSMNEKFFNEMVNLKKEYFYELLNLMKKTHDYLVVSLKKKKIYFNWDEIVFEN